jgi:hypothetical protein
MLRSRLLKVNYTVRKRPENKICNCRCLCHSLLCHTTTNFILPYVTANLSWSIKQYILTAMTAYILALISHHEKCILKLTVHLVRSSKYQVLWLSVCNVLFITKHANHISFWPYYVRKELWPILLCYMVCNYIVNVTIFGKHTSHEMCLLIFSTTFTWNFTHYKRMQ